MKDYPTNIVKHTYLWPSSVKVTGTDKTSTIEGLAEDLSVIPQATTKTPQQTLWVHLVCPNLTNWVLSPFLEYAENANISINTQERNGETVPVGIF